FLVLHVVQARHRVGRDEVSGHVGPGQEVVQFLRVELGLDGEVLLGGQHLDRVRCLARPRTQFGDRDGGHQPAPYGHAEHDQIFLFHGCRSLVETPGPATSLAGRRPSRPCERAARAAPSLDFRSRPGHPPGSWSLFARPAGPAGFERTAYFNDPAVLAGAYHSSAIAGDASHAVSFGRPATDSSIFPPLAGLPKKANPPLAPNSRGSGSL